jgi:FAD/FMN-containing dehydrogenase
MAEVVTAKGEVVTASANENPDLFWALRGGGRNFGVVTSFQFQLHPLGPIVAAAIPMYPLQDGGRVLRRWRDWVKEHSRRSDFGCRLLDYA